MCHFGIAPCDLYENDNFLFESLGRFYKNLSGVFPWKRIQPEAGTPMPGKMLRGLYSLQQNVAQDFFKTLLLHVVKCCIIGASKTLQQEDGVC